MDLRVEKTETAIKNAFMELRAHKPLEKITVKELCEKARINKSTFYAHYSDVYALSNVLEDNTINSILSSISNVQDFTPEDLEEFTRQIYLAFLSHSSLTGILFSGREQSTFASRIEKGIRELVYRKYPEYKTDPTTDLVFSYIIQGGFHAFTNHPDIDADTRIRVMMSLSHALKGLL